MTDPQVIVNLGTGGSDLNGQNGSTSSADSNDARFLDWPGDNAGNYIYLPGGANYLTAPDEAAFDVTDLDIRAYVAVDDYVGSGQRIVSRWQLPDNSFLFNLSSSGVLGLQWWNGTTSVVEGSTELIPASDYEAIWLRATLDVDNGAGAYEVKFYTSDDGSTWTQLGTTITGGSTTTLATGSSPIRVGVRGGGSEPMAAKVYRVQLMDAIDGTPVLDIDTSVISSGSATTFTALTGQTISIARRTISRKSVAVVSPVWLLGTDDQIQVSDNALLDFDADDDFTVVMMLRQWDPFTSGMTYYSKRASNVRQTMYVTGSGNNAFQIADGPNASTEDITPASSGTLTVLAGTVNRQTQVLTFSNPVDSGTNPTSSVGTLANAGLFGIGRRLDNNSDAAEMEFMGVAVFRRVLTATEITAITTYYQNKVA